MIGNVGKWLVILGMVLMMPMVASAQFPEETVEVREAGMRWPGVAVTVGGGATGYTANLRDVANVGPMVDARLVIGPNTWLGGEVNYRGATQTLDDPRLAESSNLLSSAVEGALRLNIFPEMVVHPFVAAGAGWQGFSVDTDRAGGLYRDDDVLVFPFTGGVQYAVNDTLLVDTRFVFRYVPDDNVIIREDVTNEEVRASSWETSLRVGYIF